jgi:serine/threonine-protein kinase HipA
MKLCPITYAPCGQEDYSPQGIVLLSGKTHKISPFPYSQAAQLELALEYADKLSIQGVQPKLSAKFDEESSSFKAVGRDGTFILKLQHKTFQELPQNEDLTMRLAAMAGIEIPLHGMIYAVDRSLLYFIQRFDRQKKSVANFSNLVRPKQKKAPLHKISVEDFAQLASLSRDTKYDFSMEKIIPLIEQYCTFPQSEKKRLFQRVFFSFMIGNEDMHLKNFSLIRNGELTELSPAYDLVNSSIIVKSKEELALPLRGKKSNITREDLVSYYGGERLGLPVSIIQDVLGQVEAAIPAWKEKIGHSFLSEKKQRAYLQLLENRCERVDFKF